jgi:diguanylate cyclase (GGDEF)-like protein/PAS domain S-box-containing protein
MRQSTPCGGNLKPAHGMGKPPDAVAMPTALVVDDDATMRLLMRESLEQAGFRVVEADDGPAGLRMAIDIRPDLMLLDVGMPTLGGFEVCRRLRADPITVGIPIVMVTGKDDTESIRRAFESGATDFIAKPVNWGMLGYRSRYVLRSARTLRALQHSEKQLAAILGALPDARIHIGRDMSILQFTIPPGASMFAGAALAVGCRVTAVLPSAAAERLAAGVECAFESRTPQTVDLELPGDDGPRHYEARLFHIGDEEVLGLVRDTTERERAVARMKEALIVFDSSLEGIFTTDPGGRIISVNAAYCTMSGYAADALIGQQSSLFRSNWHPSDFYEALWETLGETGSWAGEIVNRRSNGENYTQWLSISAVRDTAGSIVEYVALATDISQRKAQEEAIWRQANFDTLTGLANRNLLQDRLNRALTDGRRSGRRIGVMFLDLDGFKWINDALGHDVGDQLLQEVARRLVDAMRQQDIVARQGGDEFIVVIGDLDEADDLVVVGEKLLARLSAPYLLGDSTHHISASIGISVFPDDGNDPGSLCRSADIAMYQAKHAGKNRLQFFARHMQADAVARINMESELRAALERHEFELHYQPIIDVADARIVGAEALIRWNHPTRGLVLPGDFIPLAEDSGLIVPIGEWVLREAARQLGEWQARGLPAFRLSINVSSVQLRELGLPLLILSLLREHRIQPDTLMLEITESALLDGSEAAVSRMREIKSAGIGYSIDDFGTGYSSLKSLKQFPFDVVKIDRSFVGDSTNDPADARLVEAIINMARGLGMQVTAEGVETEAQLALLRDLGCNHAQGYLVSRPVPVAAFETLMQRASISTRLEVRSTEEMHFMAALRDDQLDVEEWLRRLLGEGSPDLVEFLSERGWKRFGLDLADTVRAHLEWRRRLGDYVDGAFSANPVDAARAASTSHCALGAWIDANPVRSTDEWIELDRVHRAFHEQAGNIVADANLGHRDRARRNLASYRFRDASRQVVIALIRCFREDMRTGTR